MGEWGARRGRGGGGGEFKRCLGQVFASKFYFSDGVSADLTETAVSEGVELKTNRDKIWETHTAGGRGGGGWGWDAGWRGGVRGGVGGGALGYTNTRKKI